MYKDKLLYVLFITSNCMALLAVILHNTKLAYQQKVEIGSYTCQSLTLSFYISRFANLKLHDIYQQYRFARGGLTVNGVLHVGIINKDKENKNNYLLFMSLLWLYCMVFSMR